MARLLLLAVVAAAGTQPPAGGSIGAWTKQLWQRRDDIWRQHEEQWRLRHGSRRPPNGAHDSAALRPYTSSPPTALADAACAGAVYVGTMKMPVIGRQTFMLRVLSWHRCQIVLIGPLSLDEPAEYAEESASASGVVSLAMTFNQPTLDLLRRWRTRIRQTQYHRDEDYATILVAPPLIPPIRIKMCAPPPCADCVCLLALTTWWPPVCSCAGGARRPETPREIGGATVAGPGERLFRADSGVL
jgi:hypothetical protein